MNTRRLAKALQAAVVLGGVAVLAFMLWEPHIEGRNAHAGWFEIYFKDPFLAYAYLSSIPFFVGLRQAYKALGYVRQDKARSPETAAALKAIQRCAWAVVAFVALSAVFFTIGDDDDRPAGIVLRLLVAVPSAAVAVAAGKHERTLVQERS